MENLKSKNSFETPTGYFDTLHNSIMNEVKEETKPRKISSYKVFAYAASILVLVGVSSLFFFNTQETKDEYYYVYESLVNYDEVTVDEYTAEFTEVNLELDENLLFDEIALN